MAENYLPVLALIVFGVIFSSLFIILSRFVGPRNPTPTKLTTYECGVEPVGTARQRFSVHFYMVAIEFILFDVEAAFLYPWAVGYRDMTKSIGFAPVFLGAAVFIGILFLGYFYTWKRGLLDWSQHGERLKMRARVGLTEKEAA